MMINRKEAAGRQSTPLAADHRDGASERSCPLCQSEADPR